MRGVMGKEGKQLFEGIEKAKSKTKENVYFFFFVGFGKFTLGSSTPVER